MKVRTLSVSAIKPKIIYKPMSSITINIFLNLSTVAVLSLFCLLYKQAI